MGAPANNVGLRTDVLDNCPKDKRIMIAIRSLSPDIIAVDEIGTKEDVVAIKTALNCGINVFATIHGKKYLRVK